MTIMKRKSGPERKKDFLQALDDHLQLDRLIQEKRDAKMQAAYGRQIGKKVVVNNEESDFFTILEIRSGARLVCFMIWRA